MLSMKQSYSDGGPGQGPCNLSILDLELVELSSE